MAVLGGGGGGAGDSYTASTAVADIPVESGSSYALSSDGKLAPSDLIVTKRRALTVPASNVYGGSGYAYAFNVYGDMVTPDGKATFHFIGDNGSGNYGIFYISLDRGLTSNGPVMNSSTGNPFDSPKIFFVALDQTAPILSLAKGTTSRFLILFSNPKYTVKAVF